MSNQGQLDKQKYHGYFEVVHSHPWCGNCIPIQDINFHPCHWHSSWNSYDHLSTTVNYCEQSSYVYILVVTLLKFLVKLVLLMRLKLCLTKKCENYVTSPKIGKNENTVKELSKRWWYPQKFAPVLEGSRRQIILGYR